MKTNKTTPQVSKDSELIKEVLEDIGYHLTDCGKYWISNAVYRGGNNPASLQIYKNSGVWIDYATGGECLPIEVLIKNTLQDDPSKCRSLLTKIGSTEKDKGQDNMVDKIVYMSQL